VWRLRKERVRSLRFFNPDGDVVAASTSVGAAKSASAPVFRKALRCNSGIGL